MTDPRLLAERLRVHQALYQELLQLVEQENQALRGSDSSYAFCQRRRQLLPELTRTLEELKTDRQLWLDLDPVERRHFPEMSVLMRACQDLIMKVIVLDRENEQTLLRRGLLPASRLPAAQGQQPHYVAQLYRRHHLETQQ